MNPNVWANVTDIDAPHGSWLAPTDVDNLKHFIQDYTIRSLIPYVEKQIATLTDTVKNGQFKENVQRLQCSIYRLRTKRA